MVSTPEAGVVTRTSLVEDRRKKELGVKLHYLDLKDLPDKFAVPAERRYEIVGTENFPWSVLARTLVINTYRPSRFDRDFPTVDRANAHTRFVCAWVRWLRIAYVAARLLDENEPRGSTLSDKLRGTADCNPAGLVLDYGSRYDLFRCQNAHCPNCHARHCVDLYDAVMAANRRRPQDSKFYLGLTYVTSADKNWAGKWFKRHATAGGVVFRHAAPPYGDELDGTPPPGGVRWRYALVACSDSRQALLRAELGCVKKIRNRFDLARYLATPLRYPTVWDTGQPARTVARISQIYAAMPGAWRYRSYGACTDGYVRGKSWSDFEGYAPGAGGVPRPERVRPAADPTDFRSVGAEGLPPRKLFPAVDGAAGPGENNPQTAEE